MADKTVPVHRETQGRGRGHIAGADYVAPAVDIYETKNRIFVVADMPGVDKDGVEIDLDEQVLTIKGNPRDLAPGEILKPEFRLMNYFRRFRLREKIDYEQVTANIQDGVLKIELPISQEKPKKIPVH